ncbi:MAG: dihydropteroate synthase [Ornithinibacter sp.]
MGVVNVTPDSFSDGGAWFTPEAAVAHGRELVAQGADLLDVGGESTRPGAERPSTAEELRRVLPVVEALSTLAPVSVDTMRADVAAAALDAGAALVNDVSGGLADPEMVPMVAQRAVPFVAMHWRGHSRDMQQRAQYDDVVADVVRELAERVEALTAAGLHPDAVLLDPGFGFAKNAQHNWELLRRLDEVVALGHRVIVGTSRKTFLGSVGRAATTARPPLERDVATAVTTAHAARHRVWCVRVHDVVATVDALDVVEALHGPEAER